MQFEKNFGKCSAISARVRNYPINVSWGLRNTEQRILLPFLLGPKQTRFFIMFYTTSVSMFSSLSWNSSSLKKVMYYFDDLCDSELNNLLIRRLFQYSHWASSSFSPQAYTRILYFPFGVFSSTWFFLLFKSTSSFFEMFTTLFFFVTFNTSSLIYLYLKMLGLYMNLTSPASSLSSSLSCQFSIISCSIFFLTSSFCSSVSSSSSEVVSK